MINEMYNKIRKDASNLIDSIVAQLAKTDPEGAEYIAALKKDYVKEVAGGFKQIDDDIERAHNEIKSIEAGIEKLERTSKHVEELENIVGDHIFYAPITLFINGEKKVIKYTMINKQFIALDPAEQESIDRIKPKALAMQYNNAKQKYT